MHPGQARCGAQTRTGAKGPCKDIAMANGRCKRHGGKSTGAKNPPHGAAVAGYSHGVYSKYYRDEEKTLIDAGAFRVGEVEAELTVMRIRLKRALEAREQWEREVASGVDGANELSMVAVEVVDDESVTKEGDVVPTVKKTKRLPDYDKLIDAAMARIESLEKTRKELLKTDDDGDPESAGESHVTFTGGLPDREL